MAEGTNTGLSDKDKLFLRLPTRLSLDKENDRCYRQSKTCASCHASDGGALAQVRRHRAYTHYKATVRHYENILNRQFEQRHKNLFGATDITYILTSQGMCYLCAIIDQCGKMVLGYRIAAEMTASLVTDTVRDALQKEKVADGLVLHSDQGAQYAAQTYYDLNQAYHLRRRCQSVDVRMTTLRWRTFSGH